MEDISWALHEINFRLYHDVLFSVVFTVCHSRSCCAVGGLPSDTIYQLMQTLQVNGSDIFSDFSSD